MIKRLFSVFALVAVVAFSAYAGNDGDREKEGKAKGYLTGSLESTNHFYVEDTKTGALVSGDHFGSNNYLKLDYYQGKFSAGLQLEGYFPVLVGYPSELTGFNISNLYASWTDESFSFTAGTFYDQFGSGLLFRSWEDRTLGLNNALTGARFAYNYKDMVNFKAFWGIPRFGIGLYNESVDTRLRGADLSLSISNMCGWGMTALSVEGSVLSKYEPVIPDIEEEGGKPSSLGYSARVNLETNGFFAKAEYVDAGEKHVMNAASGGRIKKGNAQLLECGYNGHGLGVSLTARRLEWMNTDIISGNSSTSNLYNYVPAMCTQYTYLLTTLHPYNPQTGDVLGNFMNSGEIGGQIDVFYNFRRGTKLGGKRGWKLHGNFSTYYTIAKEGTFQTGNMLFRDVSIDFEKYWTKKFKTVLLWSMQEYNPSYGQNKTTWLSNIIVADLLYKYTDKFSTRLELQYLTTHEDQKDWLAALLEVNFAPHWSVFGSDMVNHGSTGTHYYNVGVSYVKSRTRISLGYGRYKAGYICSGGVCRSIPAYTGANLSLTTSF
ncbi:MAG: DUF6029 family protein [Candidatus Cryptobacteroides sp.]